MENKAFVILIKTKEGDMYINNTLTVKLVNLFSAKFFSNEESATTHAQKMASALVATGIPYLNDIKNYIIKPVTITL